MIAIVAMVSPQYQNAGPSARRVASKSFDVIPKRGKWHAAVRRAARSRRAGRSVPLGVGAVVGVRGLADAWPPHRVGMRDATAYGEALVVALDR